MESSALWGSTLFYLFSFCSTLLALKAGQFRPGRFSFGAIFLGVLCQSWFLALRGQVEHACPIGTFSEMLIFLSWSIGWFYLVIGPTYRVSLMGTFTAPLILVLQSVGFFMLQPAHLSLRLPNAWVEAHAALSLIAFGALGLAGVAALMFLVQERQLKSQAPSSVFHHLPPMKVLEITTTRLLWLGFLLLTISFTAGFLAGLSIDGIKFWTALFLWGAYGFLLLAHQQHFVSAHRFARLAIEIFMGALVLLPGIHYLSTHLK